MINLTPPSKGQSQASPILYITLSLLNIQVLESGIGLETFHY